MQCEVVGVAEFAGHAVAEAAQLDQAGFERGSRFLGCFPDRAAFAEIRGRLQKVVDFIGRGGLAVELELEAVEHGRLLGFGRNPRGDQLRIGHRPLGGIAQRPFQLAHGERVEFGSEGEQGAGLRDQGRIAVESGIGLSGHLGCGVMARGDVGGGGPLRLLIDAVEGLVARVDEGEETVGPLLDRGSGPCRQRSKPKCCAAN